jgi:hypothetical protein
MALGALLLAACHADADGSRASADGAADVLVGSAPTGPKCGSTPTQILDLRTIPQESGVVTLYGVELAVDATNVYFGYDQALMSVPIRGGTVVTRERLSFDPQDLVVTSTRVVFHLPTGTGLDDEIRSVPLAGGSAISLATVPNGTPGFGADDQNVYFIDQEGIKRVAVSGGGVHLITSRITSSVAHGRIAVVGSNLIVPCCTSPILGSTDGNLLSVPLDGGPPTTLATHQPNVSFPQACGTNICWWTGMTPAGVAGTPGPGFIGWLLPEGGVATLPNAPYFPWSLVFDGVDFYETVGCDLCFGTLLRIPAWGAPPVFIGEGTYVAVDDTCVYYSNPDGIFSVAKSYALPLVDAGIPAGSVECSPTAGPLDGAAGDVGPTQWCVPPKGCERFNGVWACCFFDTPSITFCDVLGDAAATPDAAD